MGALVPDSKLFNVPFGTSGDKATIPETTQPSGAVSFQQGFGPDYERDPGTDPLAKRVPRDETNELYYQITNTLKFLQLYGLPEWYAADDQGNPVSYPIVARVRHGGFAWISIVANNTAEPGTDDTKWLRDDPVVAATTTVAGITRMATSAEAIAATGVAAVRAQDLVNYVRALTQPTTYYVRADGNDANTGTTNTAGGAFRNIQRAVDVAYSYGPSGFLVTIMVGAGSYQRVATPNRPGPSLLIIGDETTPANVAIAASGVDGFAVFGPNVVEVRGVKSSASGTGNAGFIAYGGATLTTRNCETGACGGACLQAFGGGALFVNGHRFAGSCSAFYLANVGGYLAIRGTQTITTAVTVGVAVAQVQETGVLAASGGAPVSFVNPGNVSGLRYVVNTNGVINTAGGGPTFFPGGNNATESGGQYV